MRGTEQLQIDSLRSDPPRPDGLRRLVDGYRDATRGYEADGAPETGSYVRVLAAYGGAVTAASVVARILRRPLPERVPAYDLVVVALATHRLSRLISRDPVTSPLRAPFTTFAGTSGPAELREEARGDGVRRAVGELVTCPFCMSQWVATAFIGGLVLAPRTTRLVASVFASTAASDFLQFARAEMVERTSAADVPSEAADTSSTALVSASRASGSAHPDASQSAKAPEDGAAHDAHTDAVPSREARRAPRMSTVENRDFADRRDEILREVGEGRSVTVHGDPGYLEALRHALHDDPCIAYLGDLTGERVLVVDPPSGAQGDDVVDIG